MIYSPWVFLLHIVSNFDGVFFWDFTNGALQYFVPSATPMDIDAAIERWNRILLIESKSTEEDKLPEGQQILLGAMRSHDIDILHVVGKTPQTIVGWALYEAQETKHEPFEKGQGRVDGKKPLTLGDWRDLRYFIYEWMCEADKRVKSRRQKLPREAFDAWCHHNGKDDFNIKQQVTQFRRSLRQIVFEKWRDAACVQGGNGKDKGKYLLAKRTPAELVAICQCDLVVGRISCIDEPPEKVVRVAGEWALDGCLVEPRFAKEPLRHKSMLSTEVFECQCRKRAEYADPVSEA